MAEMLSALDAVSSVQGIYAFIDPYMPLEIAPRA